MKTSILYSLLILLAAAMVSPAETLEIKVAKDTFGRSNERNQNSGASADLYMAHSPVVRTLIGFDLSSVTNRILFAELRLNMQNDNPRAMSFQAVPMVSTPVNSTWKEGAGSRGSQGRNALQGEVTFSCCSFPDVPWQTAMGRDARGLDDSSLWLSPVARQSVTEWKAGGQVLLKLSTVDWLEKIRTSKMPVVTLGLWGTSGNGYYVIASKESGAGPVLVLTVESPGKKAGNPVRP
ncbi:MAG: hypothetical protein JXR25_01025 [Pontiellaceae bacterium]|nr:hypothetical protein [Pontiellaceae bacterium]MBN2783381.1 hypothetical protein [Pontiellaceae bacterium]